MLKTQKNTKNNTSITIPNGAAPQALVKEKMEAKECKKCCKK